MSPKIKTPKPTTQGTIIYDCDNCKLKEHTIEKLIKQVDDLKNGNKKPKKELTDDEKKKRDAIRTQKDQKIQDEKREIAEIKKLNITLQKKLLNVTVDSDSSSDSSSDCEFCDKR